MKSLKSKTIRFNLALGLVGSLLSFLPTAREFISPEYYGHIFIALSVAGIVLRAMTTKPLADK